MGTLFIIGALILAALILSNHEKDDGEIDSRKKAAAAAYSFWIEHIDKNDSNRKLDFECHPYYSEPGSFLVAMWRYDEEYDELFSRDMIVRQDGRVRIVS